MREVMMEGKTEARVALADYEKPGYYGVGALAGLQGEVLIEDGNVGIARDRATHQRMGAGTERATLLTVARVRAWREVPLVADADLEAIEHAIAEAVPESMHTAAAPVPFRLEGNFASLALHVARGACPHAATSPETEPDRWSSSTEGASGTVAGFFAPGRAGVMTHHGSAIHAHARVRPAKQPISLLGDSAMGHVDSLVCAPGAKLFVPAR
ncbi:MAG: acetolactate decarboxylase [Planctomycetota bacterium]|nr:acetolactate decarboxylase [Planctomycetota bacterium]